MNSEIRQTAGNACTAPEPLLLDEAAFDAALDTTDDPLPLFRDTLKRATALLKECFEQGEAAGELVHRRAQLVDSLLVRACRRFLHVSEAMEDEIALVAVGGYGRGELHPGSDIDIMILLPGSDHALYRDCVERFLTFLWDIGLEVGHSTRTLEECVTQASQDITVVTNLMETRLLVGSQELFARMRAATGPDRIWPTRQFFEAKLAEQQARHQRFHDTAYNLEPNTKEGRGGLRDLQMIGWVAKRHSGADTLHGLVSDGFLSEEEFHSLTEAQEFLWRVRMALHYLTGRGEDRLLFDYQTRLAEQFGYQNRDHQLAVEQFMKDYYRTIGSLDRLNEMLLQLFQEAILYADESGEPQPLNSRFQVRRGFMEATGPQVFKHYPFALLEMFLILAQNPELKGVTAETIRLVRTHLHLIDDEFRNDLRCRSLFIELMRQPHGVTHELRRMHRYGVLGAYLPLFGSIVGQMQYDLFHAYTVDEHTLFVVRNVRRFAVPMHADEFPQCTAIIRRLPKPEILNLAALFHDIAKGRGGDHSELGAEDARDFCLHHGMSRYDGNFVAWLVRHHLIMSMTAQREDISDPDVITRFATRVGDQAHLDYLYLLTVADMRGTNPELWNAWKGALLGELYATTRQALRRGLQTPVDQSAAVEEAQRLAREELKEKGVPDAKIDALWDDLGQEYFLRYSASDISRHTQSILDSKREPLPLLLVYEAQDHGGVAIFVHNEAQRGLFGTVTGTLEQLGLSIADARIITTSSGLTMDTYIVLEQSGEVIRDPYRIREMREALRERIMHPEAALPTISRRVPRQHKHFVVPNEVSFHVDARNRRTIMQVTTSDRPGLLAIIARVLHDHGILIQNAKIATIGSRAEDIFFITDEHNEPLDTNLQEHLRSNIVAELGQAKV